MGEPVTAGVGVVFRVRRLMEDEFVVAIAIEVADRRVARAVVLKRADRDFEIGVGPGTDEVVRSGRLFFIRRRDGVSYGGNVPGRIIRVIRGSCDGRRIDFCGGLVVRSPENVECGFFGVGSEEPPAYEDFPAIGEDSDRAAIQRFHLTRSGRARAQRQGEEDDGCELTGDGIHQQAGIIELTGVCGGCHPLLTSDKSVIGSFEANCSISRFDPVPWFP